MAEGGDAAEEAFKKLAVKHGRAYAENLPKLAGQDLNPLDQMMTEYLDQYENGMPFDATQMLQDIMQQYNLAGAEGLRIARGIAEQYGFQLSPSTIPAWVDTKTGAIVLDEPDNMDGYEETTVFMGASTSAAGTGAVSFGGGGGGSSKYENSHDKFYNSYEKINAIIRERNKLEREYDRILSNRTKTGKQLVENAKQQIEALKQEQKLQEYVKEGKFREIEDLMSKNSKYSKYITGFDKETGAIQINWDEFNKIKDTELGEKVDKYLSELEGLRDQWQEADDALNDILDTVEQIREQGKEQYFDLEERIKQGLLAQEQKKIDALSEINNSINDTNSKILDSMQEQIDQYRQNRDNEKTEKELEDKQRRLAYLQQDTSGANAMEILNLQKEIEEGQESYTDKLIDQKISELQKQNDQAAEQRERQIELMQNQLEHYEQSGEIWQDVYELWENGVDEDGMLMSGSRLEEILKESESFQGLSALGQKDWMDQLAESIKSAFGLFEGEGLRAKEGETITFKNKSGQWLTGVADAEGNIVVGDTTYSGVHQIYNGSWVTDEEEGTKNTPEDSGKGDGSIAGLPGRVSLSSSEVRKLQTGLNNMLDDEILEGFDKLSVDGDYGPKTKQAVRILQQKLGVAADGIWGPGTKSAFDASDLKAYKSGGLADFTGPAWLDGTKSKPEYILSADQTKAFFTLVDVLSGLRSGSSNSTEKSGDNMYDIDINVERIDSDYDVEQLANKIKSLINEDARYRNNNTINLMR